MPLPDAADPLLRPFWDAARESVLVVQRCGDCGYPRWPPSRICPECQGERADWQPVSQSGEVWSFATYHRALSKAFPDVPYTVGLIQLDAGPRMLGTLLIPVGQLRIGQRVRAVFDPVSPDIKLVRWTSADEE